MVGYVNTREIWAIITFSCGVKDPLTCGYNSSRAELLFHEIYLEL